MDYVARLPVSVCSNLDSLASALASRFGDHVLPETYRATLQNLKKRPKELHQYAAGVKALMGKAYPGLEGTQLFVDLTIEHVVNGIAETDLAYDVLTKKPRTVEEALDMIAWHECCKGSSGRKASLRQVASKST